MLCHLGKVMHLPHSSGLWNRCWLVFTGLPVWLVYLDDNIVFSRMVAEHLGQLRDVFTRLKNAGLKLKPSKCHLLQNKICYFGHVVSGKGIETDPDKIRSVFDWPTPLNHKNLKRFLGLASYYRRFVQGFAQVAAPLNALTNKGKEWLWTAECIQAFLELKKRLVSAPVLVMPQFSQDFLLDTDASGESLGTVLSQVVAGQERVVAYASKTLTKTERKYRATCCEMLALVWATHHFRPYLYGRRLVLRIRDVRVQRMLLAEAGLTFAKAFGLAQTSELVEKNVQELQHSEGTPVHPVHKVEPAARPWSGNCFCCGSKHKVSDCRCKSLVCYKCGKQGHVARVCRSHGDGGNKGTRDDGRLDEQSGKKSMDGEKTETYALYKLSSSKSQMPLVQLLTVNGIPLQMQVDTGAVVSLISESTYQRVWPRVRHPALEKSGISLHTYMGESINVVGKICVDMQYGGQYYRSLNLLIVQGRGPSLIGRDWQLKINLFVLCRS